MIFIRVYYLNEFGLETTGVLEVSRDTTIGDLAGRGYHRVELL